MRDGEEADFEGRREEAEARDQVAGVRSCHSGDPNPPADILDVVSDECGKYHDSKAFREPRRGNADNTRDKNTIRQVRNGERGQEEPLPLFEAMVARS